MEIAGPLTIGLVEKLDGPGRELHIGFREDFRRLPLAEQGAQFRAYLADLTAAVFELDEADPNRPGLLLIQQIAEQLLPHVEAGELSLGDTIVVEIGGVRQYIQLTDASVAGIAAADGRMLWRAARKGSVAVIPTPIYHDGGVYVTSGYGAGSQMFKIMAAEGRTCIFAESICDRLANG
jgi:hypothetical protein